MTHDRELRNRYNRYPGCAVRMKKKSEFVLVEDFLMHYGVKGQKRGHRRWQNEDGSLTEEGKIHYGIGVGERRRGKVEDNDQRKQKKELTPEEREARKKKVKKILAITAGVTLAAAAGYMAYRAGDQWVGALRKDYQAQAEGMHDLWKDKSASAANKKRLALSEAKDITSRMNNRNKLNVIGRTRDSKRRHEKVAAALGYARDSGSARKIAESYMNRGKNVSVAELVMNFIKNSGKIVVR